jgi:hypothetical protein
MGQKRNQNAKYPKTTIPTFPDMKTYVLIRISKLGRCVFYLSGVQVVLLTAEINV